MSKEIFIIAEIGINHNGSMEICKELIDVAKDAGCDAVKFQKRSVEKVYTKDFLDSYRDSPWGKTQREQKFGIEFSRADYLDISNTARILILIGLLLLGILIVRSFSMDSPVNITK